MDFDIPNLRHLRAFSEVATHNRISAAADRVHLSQPAITQAIAKLEETLGAPLFDRRTEGMFPTEVGAMFKIRVDKVFEHLKLGAREAGKLGGCKGEAKGSRFDHLMTAVQLRAIAAVAEHQNFSLAAHNIGISQPSMHRAARDLERLSGVTLFKRSRQGIELTEAARALAQQVKLAINELNQGLTEVQEWLGRDVGIIRLGTLPLPRTYVVPTAINRLCDERPSVTVSAVDGPFDDLLHALRHGELDLLIGALRDPPPIDDIEQEALFDAPLAVVARAGHPLAAAKRVTTSELAAYPWVVPRQGTPTRATFDALMRNVDNRPAGLVESSSLGLIRALLLESDRLTLISSHQIMHEEELGLLVRLPFAVAVEQRDIGLTVRKGWRPTSAQRRFIELLREASKNVG